MVLNFSIFILELQANMYSTVVFETKKSYHIRLFRPHLMPLMICVLLLLEGNFSVFVAVLQMIYSFLPNQYL